MNILEQKINEIGKYKGNKSDIQAVFEIANKSIPSDFTQTTTVPIAEIFVSFLQRLNLRVPVALEFDVTKDYKIDIMSKDTGIGHIYKIIIGNNFPKEGTLLELVKSLAHGALHIFIFETLGQDIPEEEFDNLSKTIYGEIV